MPEVERMSRFRHICYSITYDYSIQMIISYVLSILLGRCTSDTSTVPPSAILVAAKALIILLQNITLVQVKKYLFKLFCEE